MHVACMHRIDVLIAALFAAILGGPAETRSRATKAVPHFVAPAPNRPRLVLVTIDGVRWQEIFTGIDQDRAPALGAQSVESLTPNLHALGAMMGGPGRGAVEASGPNYVSLPGYREILSGRPSACQSNDCTDRAPRTFLDAAQAAGLRVAAFGSWERLDRAVSSEPGSFHVSVGQGGDTRIDPFPGSGDFRPDAITAKLALEWLEGEKPDLLYLGLGEPDEYAHRGDYLGYVGSIHAADEIVGRVVATLAKLDGRGAHVIVTADHGRDRHFCHHGGYDPDSKRVWLAAGGPRIRARGLVTSHSAHRLFEVAPTSRVCSGFPAAERPSASSSKIEPSLGGQRATGARGTNPPAKGQSRDGSCGEFAITSRASVAGRALDVALSVRSPPAIAVRSLARLPRGE